MTAPTALAASLARPVARGLLPIEQAEAALAVALARQERAGTSAGSGTFDEKLAIDRHILGLHLEALEDLRSTVAHAIHRQSRPMIERGAQRGRVRAQAHDINAEHGNCFGEDEVEGVLLDLLQSMEAKARVNSPARRRRYHV